MCIIICVNVFKKKKKIVEEASFWKYSWNWILNLEDESMLSWNNERCENSA